VLPQELAAQVSLTESERARLLKPDYAYAAGRTQRTQDFWNKEFKG
jgi:putative spermidine/putrescine transport system substrate-binding protein